MKEIIAEMNVTTSYDNKEVSINGIRELSKEQDSVYFNADELMQMVKMLKPNCILIEESDIDKTRLKFFFLSAIQREVKNNRDKLLLADELTKKLREYLLNSLTE